jgi:predicted PurR-regulated permease PerM
MDNNSPQLDTTTFAQRVSITVGITLLFVLLIWLFGVSFDVFLLIVAALLIALPLRAGGKKLHQKFGWNETISLVVVIVGVLGLLTAMIWLLATRISEQIAEFQEQIPTAVANFEQRLASSPTGKQILNSIPDPSQMLQNGSKLLTQATGLVSSTFGALSTLYGVLFMAAFIVVDPTLYRRGIIWLVPKRGRRRAGEVLDQLDKTLVHWLMGQLFSMTVVGMLTGLGLWLLGVRLAGVLALFAGLISFIPNLGPIIALVPAVLFAFLDGPQQALYVVILYLSVQFIESSLATPMVQKKLIDMPPALVFGSQLVLGSFGGILGLMLATPIVAVLMVLTQMLYVQDVLDDKTMKIDS